MEGHKVGNKFHPHSKHQSVIHSSDVHSSKIKSKNSPREFMFQLSGGYSIDGKGSTPKEALEDAKKKFKKMKSHPVWKNQNLGKLTGNYNTYGNDGTAPTGYYPKRIKV